MEMAQERLRTTALVERGAGHKLLREQMVGIMLVLKDWEDLPACYARMSFFLWSKQDRKR